MYDVIIIGSGPAGLTAAIYTTRANLKTLIIAGGKWGGQLMLTSVVENYPGFPEGIHGPDLMLAMRKQAEKHGTEIVEKDFTRLQLPSQPARLDKQGVSGRSDGGQVRGEFTKSPFTITAGDSTYQAKSIIIATGADTKWLGVPGEQEKIGRGVSSCAPCDGAFFRNKKVIVVGGGDAAMEEALFLTKFASSVIIVHRSDQLRASKVMQERAMANPKIQFLFNTTVEEIIGKNNVERVRLSSKLKAQSSKVQLKSQNREKEVLPEEIGGKKLEANSQELKWEMPIDGVFVAIGHFPNSKMFQGIDMDEKGFITVHDHFKTNIEGVFVAGDVHDGEYKQAITAAGFGCAAALETERWLMQLPQVTE